MATEKKRSAARARAAGDPHPAGSEGENEMPVAAGLDYQVMQGLDHILHSQDNSGCKDATWKSILSLSAAKASAHLRRQSISLATALVCYQEQKMNQKQTQHRVVALD